MSFFGGDLSKSHFAVGVRYLAFRGEGHKASTERRRAERATIKAAGFKETTYFEYRNGDEAGKASAKAAADAEAARITAATGVEMEVAEGCFL